VKRLLILACSSRKRSDQGLLPAIQRYDGPSFRVLRKYLRSVSDEDLKVLIISAEFGLIADREPIPDYDRFMNTQRTLQLRPKVVNQFGKVMSEIAPASMMISAGQTYMRAMPDLQAIRARGVVVKVADGPPGKKLSGLHDWLYQDNHQG
jgi:hypothetical protein